MWHDFVTHLSDIQPPTAILIARRHPEDTALLTGSLSPDGTGMLVGPQHWFIPWPFITRWRFAPALPSTPPLAPSQPLPATAWRDIYATPPADGQPCWVRRCPEDTASFKAVWTLDTEPYFLLEVGWQLPWYLATRWRPAAT